ncbi:MAG: ABC transporter substrate-binding protein [Treponema sp.]|nr:ABC transporter substrate-binding protein [Treponema sp.]
MLKKFFRPSFARAFCALFSVFFSFFCFSCDKKTRTAAEPNPVLLGFSQIGAESAWRTYHSKNIRAAADEAGVQLLFSNAEQKQENQIKAIRSFIAYRVDVIAFVPIVQDGWDTVLREAAKAGIPVIVCDRKIRTSDESLYAAYIGTDSMEEGRKAARFLQEKYSAEADDSTSSPTNRPLNILEIRGTDGSSASDDRIRGFHELIDKDQRFRVLESVQGNFMRSRGREIAENLLKEGGEGLTVGGKPVDILFSANDGMTLGFIEVLRKHNIAAGKDLTIVSFDAQQEAIDALKNSEINCVVECTPNMGRNIMECAKRLAAGEPVPRMTHIEERVFVEGEDLSAVPPRGY